MCVKESLRLNGPVPFVTRKMAVDTAFPGKVTIPKGN